MSNVNPCLSYFIALVARIQVYRTNDNQQFKEHRASRKRLQFKGPCTG